MDALFAELPPEPPEPTPDTRAAREKAITEKNRAARKLPQAERWRQRFRDALAQNSFPPVLRLAQEIINVDREDTALDKSATYIRVLNAKDVELTTIVLHLMDAAGRVALVEGDYNALRNSPALPRQLTEALPPNPVSHNHKETATSKNPPRRPCMYMHFHVDDQGNPPTLNQLIATAVYIQSYVDVGTALLRGERPKPADLDRVKQVDCLVPAPVTPFAAATPTTPATPRGTTRLPYVFDQYNPRYGAKKIPMAALRQWLKAVNELRRVTPASQRDVPLKQAPTETGWTIEPNTRRFAQLEHGAGSNKIMNVVESAFRVANPGCTHLMRWLIVLEIVRSDLAAVGERTLSRAAASYTTAGGTNQSLGGISTESAKKITERAYLNAGTDQQAHIRSSVAADHDVAGREVKKVLDFEKASSDWKILLELQREADQVVDDTAKAEETNKTLGNELLANGPEWAKRTRREMEAVKSQEQMVDLATRLEGLL